MIIGNIKNIKTAKRYSNALLKSAIDAGSLEKIYNDLIFVDETIRVNSQLKEFIENPVIKNQDKKDVINKLFSVHVEKITLDFLFVLIDSGRIDIFGEVLNQFFIKYNVQNNIVKPVIISAVELNENQKMLLAEKLEKKLLKKIMPKYAVDSNIIGGLIVEIGDKTIDCSLKTKFYNMKQQLIKGNKYGSD